MNLGFLLKQKQNRLFEDPDYFERSAWDFHSPKNTGNWAVQEACQAHDIIGSLWASP